MYPNSYLRLFPPFPRDDRVFVAMSFDPQFDARWHNVIQRTVEAIKKPDGATLKAHRVDMRVGLSPTTSTMSQPSRTRMVRH